MSNKQQLLKDKEKYIVDFSNELLTLITAFWRINKKDPFILEIYERYGIIKRENPNLLIEIVGPYIWKYRETITLGNLDSLLNNTFNEEITEIIGMIPDTLDKIHDIIKSIKRTWTLFSYAEKEIIRKKSKTLLTIYSGYISICKLII